MLETKKLSSRFGPIKRPQKPSCLHNRSSRLFLTTDCPDQKELFQAARFRRLKSPSYWFPKLPNSINGSDKAGGSILVLERVAECPQQLFEIERRTLNVEPSFVLNVNGS